jgi:hypothetical protein
LKTKCPVKYLDLRERLHKKELQNLQKRLKWVGHMARCGEKEHIQNSGGKISWKMSISNTKTTMGR